MQTVDEVQEVQIVSEEVDPQEVQGTDVDERLKESVIRVSKLIKELNDLSFALNKIESKQNILSLNASIEAARAGEAGRGFAVVAQEVGKLASNSAQINGNIKEILGKLTDEVAKMVKLEEGDL